MKSVIVEPDWFICTKPNPRANLRLFCFPYAGSNPYIFRSWAAGPFNDIEIYSLQLPGRGARFREQPLKSAHAIVSEAAKAIIPYLDRPFAFFGHSMGAIVSYELALHLQKNNWPIPSLLFVSACRAPHLEDDEPPLHTLARDEFIKRLETLNGTPKEVLNNHELLELMLPVLRADFAVCETYNNQDVYRLNSPIRAFGGQEDPKVLLEHLEAWGEHTRSSFSVRMFPGDHFYLHSNESLLLQDISAELDYRLKVSA